MQNEKLGEWRNQILSKLVLACWLVGFVEILKYYEKIIIIVEIIKTVIFNAISVFFSLKYIRIAYENFMALDF